MRFRNSAFSAKPYGKMLGHSKKLMCRSGFRDQATSNLASPRFLNAGSLKRLLPETCSSFFH